MADINSSDQEYEPPAPKAYPRAGMKVTEKMLQRPDDRFTTKQNYKNLQHGDGSPENVRYLLSKWENRFQAWREQVLFQDPSEVFTGETLQRFIDAVIPQLKPNVRGKPAPSVSTIQAAIDSLVSYGTFTWRKFQFTPYDRKRMETFINARAKQGRLTTGTYQQKQWLTYTMVDRMVQAFLADGHEKGIRSWDVHIMKILHVLLPASLASRAGDVSQSDKYTGTEYLQWNDIEITFDGEADEPRLENLVAKVTLKYRKGVKMSANEASVMFLTTLGAEDAHMCVIRWIIIHALRHATPHVLNRSLKAMGLAANILGRVNIHALRYGAARDLSKLPGGMPLAAEVLGHRSTAVSQTTKMYVGPTDRPLWTERAEAKMPSLDDPKFSSASAVEALHGAEITMQDCQRWYDENDPSVDLLGLWHKVREQGLETDDPESRRFQRLKMNARNAIKAQRMKHFNETAPVERNGQEIITRHKTTLQGFVTAHNEASVAGDAEEEPDEDEENPAVDEVEFARLEDQVLQAGQNVQIRPQEEQDSLALELGSSLDRLRSGDEYAFVNAYAKINIVNHKYFSTAYPRYRDGRATYGASVGKYAVRGNSRDDPSPFPLPCTTQGCGETFLNYENYLTHVKTCTEDRVARRAKLAEREEPTLPCTEPGCTKKYRRVPDLKKHMETHKWVPRTCVEDGCDPKQQKLFNSKVSWDQHNEKYHGGRWPAKCIIEDCPQPDKEFTGPVHFSTHLRDYHNMPDGKDRSAYVRNFRGALPPAMMLKPQACPIGGCKRPSQQYTSERYMKEHLMNIHEYEEDAADLMVQALERQEKPDPVVPAKRKAT
ncbi:hypothetical protein KCV07_g2042, partial [Aureobasidium melanogenum]